MADKMLQNGTIPNGSADTAQLDASSLKDRILNIPPPRPGSRLPPNSKSQKVCTDHMITASWTQTDGSAAPELKHYGPFQLMPTAL